MQPIRIMIIILTLVTLVLSTAFVILRKDNNVLQFRVNTIKKESDLLKKQDDWYFGITVNDKIESLFKKGYSEDIYSFYDNFTMNRDITYNLLEKALSNNIPVNKFLSLAWAESRFNLNAINNDSNENNSIDYGLMQLNSITYNEYSKDYLMDLKNNIELSARHLVNDKEKYGSWEKSFIAYNCGTIDRVPKRSIEHFISVFEFEKFLDVKFNSFFQEE
jgi:hypothetical protein